MKISHLLFVTATLGLASASTAYSQLFVHATFSGPSTPNVTINNGTLGARETVTFATGTGATNTKNQAAFREPSTTAASQAFHTYSPIAIGGVGFTNGVSTGAVATYADLVITLTFNTGPSIVLGPITFSLDSVSGLGDNKFGTISGLTGEISYMGGDYTYTLTGMGFTTFTLNEGGAGNFVTNQAAFITFTPIPEPSTYGLMGAVGLLGFVVYRRRATRKVVA